MYSQALITDLYQLTMAAGYWEESFKQTATFELFVRKLPTNRSFLVASGIEQCVNYLSNLSFQDDDIEFLRSNKLFSNVSKEFFNYLADFRFTGDVYAIKEGTLFFPNEPVIRITAPIIQAQIVETFLLSMFNFQTMIATKAARINMVSKDKDIVEFGTRRAHSPEAGILAARAAYVGGCVGTSNVLAGMKYNIPIFGTMAHSWVMSFQSEEDSFKAYSKIFPQNNILLIDTYDTINAAKMVAKLPFKISGVRLDSGNFEYLSKEVRNILDSYGKTDTKILVSGDMNEYKIKELLENNAPIDIFGVGTELSTSKDAPSLSGVYKLVEITSNDTVTYKAKFSPGKKSYPAKKQVYRFYKPNGLFDYDIIAMDGELANQDADELLKPVIINGKVISEFNLQKAQNHCKNSMSKLPKEYKDINSDVTFLVKISEKLEKLSENLKNSLCLSYKH